MSASGVLSTAQSNTTRVARVQELRRSNAATAIPSKKVYNRKKIKREKPE